MDRLANTVRPYAWGSTTAIPDLLGIAPTGEPQAEMWMGAHPGAPSRVDRGAGAAPLADVIDADPEARTGRARPSPSSAPACPSCSRSSPPAPPSPSRSTPTSPRRKEGYADEERRGVPIDAPHRNYKDANHKPELICALTPVRRPVRLPRPVGGRRPPRRPRRRLPQAVRRPAARPPRGGRAARGADRRPHRRPRARWPRTVTEAAAACDRARRRRTPRTPLRIAHHYPGDPGVIAAMLLNHVRLQPGEALFLGAGVPHAYLDGLGVEIMANSDNVLRCGLTPKHVDVPELLRIVRFEASDPGVLRPEAVARRRGGLRDPHRRVPALPLRPGPGGAAPATSPPRTPQILLCTGGLACRSAAANSPWPRASRSSYRPGEKAEAVRRRARSSAPPWWPDGRVARGCPAGCNNGPPQRPGKATGSRSDRDEGTTGTHERVRRNQGDRGGTRRQPRHRGSEVRGVRSSAARRRCSPESVHSLADSGNQGAAAARRQEGPARGDPAAPLRLRPRALHLRLPRLHRALLGRRHVRASTRATRRSSTRTRSRHWYWPVGVLVFAIIAEALLLPYGHQGVERDPRQRCPGREFVRRAKAPELPVVLLEDLGALVGLVLALVGVGLALATGDGVWDGIGTLCIGVLLDPDRPRPGGRDQVAAAGRGRRRRRRREDQGRDRRRRHRHRHHPHAHPPPRPRGTAGRRQDRRPARRHGRRGRHAPSTPPRPASATPSRSPASSTWSRTSTARPRPRAANAPESGRGGPTPRRRTVAPTPRGPRPESRQRRCRCADRRPGHRHDCVQSAAKPSGLPWRVTGRSTGVAFVIESQTSLLMAVGRSPQGPAEGERASDGLRCAQGPGMSVRASGHARSQPPRAAVPTLDPHTRSSSHDDCRQRPGLQGRRPLPRRLRPQGDHPRRARDARPDGDPQGVRRSPAAGRRPDHRLAAHDRADRRPDRDPGRARRRGPLGVLQHLLHPGPRRRRHRRRPERHPGEPAGRPGLRLEGRDAGGVLVVHRAGADLAEHPHRRPEHDPRRRRRRHPARPQGRRVREGRRRPRPPTPRTARSTASSSTC